MTDVRQLAHDLQQLREDVDYLTVLLEPGLAATGTATVVAQPLTQPAASGSPPRATAAPCVWHILTANEAASAWNVLATWVDWLIGRYQLDDTLPACWYQHGAIVDELDALRVAWVGAYLDSNSRPTDAAYWHELLARGLTRIRDWDRYGCAAGKHHPDASLAHDNAEREKREDYLRGDVESRARSPHVVAHGTDEP